MYHIAEWLDKKLESRYEMIARTITTDEKFEEKMEDLSTFLQKYYHVNW